MKVNVNAQAETQPRPPGQEPACQVEGNAVDIGTAELPQPAVAQAHERKGCQEMLAKLPVTRPGLTGARTSNESVSMKTGRPRQNCTL